MFKESFVIQLSRFLIIFSISAINNVANSQQSYSIALGG